MTDRERLHFKKMSPKRKYVKTGNFTKVSLAKRKEDTQKRRVTFLANLMTKRKSRSKKNKDSTKESSAENSTPPPLPRNSTPPSLAPKE